MMVNRGHLSALRLLHLTGRSLGRAVLLSLDPIQRPPGEPMIGIAFQ
jgi:hypothetical protein